MLIDPRSFYVDLFCENDLQYIDSFDCGDQEMNDFFKKEFYEEMILGLNATYALFYKGELAVLCSICADRINLASDEKEETELPRGAVPSIKVARIGRNVKFKEFRLGKLMLEAYQKLQVDTIQSAKFIKGIQLISELVKNGKKVIVWGMFVKTMQKIQRELQRKGILVNLVYGGTPKDERVQLINDFRDGDVQVMISNPNTLGESISLHQTVHDAVYFEYNFNLTFMLQSRDRIHRLGLKEDQYTRYYYLMTEGDRAHGGFIDQAVYKRLKEKEQIMLDAIDGELLIPEVTDNYLEDVKNIIQI